LEVVNVALSRKNGLAKSASTNFVVELRERAVQKKAQAANAGSHELVSHEIAPENVAHDGTIGLEVAAELVEELHTYQIELEMQNEELRLAQADLERSRARYFDLYDLAPVGYVTLDDEGAVIEMNVRAGTLLAAPRAALEGRSFSRLIGAEDQDTYYLSRKRLLKTQEPQFCELRMVPLAAPPFWARLEMSLGMERTRELVCRIVIVDITERKAAELQAQESERQLRQQANAMPQIVWTSAPGGEVDYYNERWYEYTGFASDQLDRNWQSAVHPADLPDCIFTSSRGFATGSEFAFLCRLRRASDGEYRWHLARAVPDPDQQGEILRWFGTFTDIHEQEMAKVLLEAEVRNRTHAFERLETKENELRRLLSEKDTLLQEIHHRVKNNLQVISSLLRMQGDLLKDNQAADALRDSQRRIVSMAHIHELLYSGQCMDQIDFADYTRTLVVDLLHSFNGSGHGITARLNTAQVVLKVDQAIPCGLILNELVTNAVKYAYAPGTSGEIVVELSENHAGVVKLSVADQGIGLPAGFDWQNSKSMGLPIVDLLTNQLGGTLQVQTGSGAAFSLEFPNETQRRLRAAKP
jgi:PAS domain S-box-containing protein